MTTQSENQVLHRPVTFSAAPNYALLSGANADLQLTDGLYATDAPQVSVNDTGALWVQKGTVGWTNVSPVILTIDLGQEQPIGGALFSTAAGEAGVNWPLHVFIGVSDDNENWRFAGDLVALSDKIQAPPEHGYATWRYRTDDLKARGRYVAFAVTQVPYAFADQIEIYRGADDLLQSPMRAEAVAGTDEFARTSVMRGAVTNLLTQHAEAVAGELQSANLPTELRRELQNQLDAATAAIETLPVPDAETFRAALPFNDTHAKILAVHGAILGAQKAGPMLWQQPRYQWLSLLATPPDKASPHLRIAMMKNEFRANSLMLTNASAQPLDASLQLDGPLAQHRAALQISAMPWTDTAQSVPVAAALPILDAAADGSYDFSVPAGLTTKLWFSLDSSQLPVGVHQGDIHFTMSGQTARVPYTIRVSPVTMSQPRLSLGVWDYTDGDSAFDINEANRASAIELLRSHGADTAWAQKRALPLPGADDFNAKNELIAPLNWKPFEAWRERWPDARQYFVYLDVPTEFAGAQMNTPQFDARVSSWARAVSLGVRERGLRTGQLGLLLVDEPLSEEKDDLVAAWARPIKSAAPELTLFEDTLWERPDLTKNQDAITLLDIICLNLLSFKRNEEPVAPYSRARQAAGQTLWFYQTQEPSRLMNPASYDRLFSWHAFKQGAKGIGFWAFGDAGGAGTSWNEHLASRPTYTPVFIGPTEVTNGIHWDAVREGLQDHEYLAMLRDKIVASTDETWKTQAQKLLDEAVDAVIDDAPQSKLWQNGGSGEAADEYRLKILAMLEAAEV